MTAFFIGLLVSLVIIVSIKIVRTEDSTWSYPVTLGIIVCFYLAFALYAKDYQALFYEALWALPFVFILLFSLKRRNKTTLMLLSIGFIGHGLYDLLHNELFINTGTPDYWPVFCSTVDIAVGLYLIYLAAQMKAGEFQQPAKTL